MKFDINAKMDLGKFVGANHDRAKDMKADLNLSVDVSMEELAVLATSDIVKEAISALVSGNIQLPVAETVDVPKSEIKTPDISQAIADAASVFAKAIK